jgi:hypothetical protein
MDLEIEAFRSETRDSLALKDALPHASVLLALRCTPREAVVLACPQVCPC